MDFYIFQSREDWRSWLKANHQFANEIWLGYYKKHTGKVSLSYNEAVEEAICFGWIDSLVKRVDENIYKQKYTPRKKNSIWSMQNVRRAEKMIDEGKMTPRGWEQINIAKKNGRWEEAYGIEKEYEVPEDLLRSLKSNKKAFTNFFNYSLSLRNRFIYWINQAKRKETREKRILDVTKISEQNIKPGM